MKDKNYLHNMYNATSTDDGTGTDEIETYENWLERQLISRIEVIEQHEAKLKNHKDLHNVRQQRELLNAFAGKWNAANIDWENIEIYDNEIEDFIKGIL